jgi:hypothetical protein
MKLIATVIFTRIEAGNFLLCVMYFQPTALFLCRKKKEVKKKRKKNIKYKNIYIIFFVLDG